MGSFQNIDFQSLFSKLIKHAPTCTTTTSPGSLAPAAAAAAACSRVTMYSTACLSQVWSLTHFYSADFSQSRISVKECVFNKRTIKACISSLLRCPGTPEPCTSDLAVSLYLCTSASNSQGESRVQGGDEWFARRNYREQCFPDKGSLM